MLLRGGIFAGGVVLAVVVTAAVLLPLQLWRPVVALPVITVAAALVYRFSALVPVEPVRGWTAWGTVAVATGHSLWAALTHAEHVVVRRDGGSYALYTQWVATHHGLPIDAHVEALGGAEALADPAFRLASPAFYQMLFGSGADLTGIVVPQFLPGSPAVWSLGYWAGGWQGMLITPAIVSGLAIFAFGGLAARLIGPAAAPLAALVLAVTQPVLHAARSTYSEPVALLLLCAAMGLLVAAVRTGSGPAPTTRLVSTRLALAAGAMLGLAGLVRVDVIREVALLLPVAAVLALRAHPAARPLVVAALTGLGFSTGWALLNSLPYLGSIAGSLLPLVGGAVLLGALSLWVVRRSRRGGLRRLVHPEPSTWAPRITAGLVVLVGLALACRPLWLVVRQDPDDSGSRFVARLQPSQGLLVDGGRTYAEQSVTWVAWWTGAISVIVALAVFAGLARRWVIWWQSGSLRVPAWFGPAFIGLGSTVLSLYRPGITPDHPWADRRLVTVVLPSVVLASVAGLAWAVRRVRHNRRAVHRWAAPTLAGIGSLALVVPPIIATAPVATQRTELGELRAQREVCAALQPGDVVLAVDSRAINEWPQVIRGVCGHPAAVVRVDVTKPDELRAAVTRAAERVAATGHRPVLMTADSDAVLRYLGLEPQQVTDVVTTEDQRLLTRRPSGEQKLDIDVWLAPWQ